MTRYSKEYRDVAYKTYVTDSLQLNVQNKYLTSRYYDIINTNKAIDNRSADEIVLDVILNAGLSSIVLLLLS